MTKQVFISHNAEADSQFAQQLAADLQALGLSVWIAPQSIRRGESFPGAISRRLASSAYFLLAMTPAGLGSRWVQLETDAALDLEMKDQIEIIPLEVKRSVLPPLLSTRQVISFEGSYLQGLAELCKVLGLEEVRPEDSLYQDDRPLDLRDRSGMATDSFVEGALTDLGRAMSVMSYLMSRVEPSSRSIIRAIVENKTSLRIGISIHSDPELRVNSLLAQLSCELAENPHRVSGIFAIQSSRHPEMQPYELNDSPAVTRCTSNGTSSMAERPWGRGSPFSLTSLEAAGVTAGKPNLPGLSI